MTAMPSGWTPTIRQAPRIFREMAKEEDGHRRALIAEHERRFGPTIPLIRREHVADYVSRQPIWLVENLGLDRIRAEAERWRRTRRGSTRLPPSAARTPARAACSAISPPPSGPTSTAPRS